MPPTQPSELPRSETTRHAGGEGTVTIVAPHLLTTVVRGVATEAMVINYFRVFHEFIDGATRRLDVFHDWYDATAVEPAARALYLRWVHERQERHSRIFRTVTVLVRSRLLWIALQAGAIRSGYARSLRAREPFEHALREAIALPSSEPIAR